MGDRHLGRTKVYKHILIATDGSDLATRAVEHGIGLAKSQHARVTIVTVTERWSAFFLGDQSRQGVIDPLNKYETETAAVAKGILDKAGRIGAAQDVPCKLMHVPDQSPAEGILATAKSEGCDLIVMGSHGHRGLDRVLVGSRAYEVLAYSKMPVLIIK
jgi:nucleotide-binding universal stress UspA family protein